MADIRLPPKSRLDTPALWSFWSQMELLVKLTPNHSDFFVASCVSHQSPLQVARCHFAYCRRHKRASQTLPHPCQSFLVANARHNASMMTKHNTVTVQTTKQAQLAVSAHETHTAQHSDCTARGRVQWH